MERAGQVKRDEVRHVDKRRDRPETNRFQSVLQPSGAGTILHAPDVATDEHRTSVSRLGVEAEFDTDRTLESSGNRLGPKRLQISQPRCREVTRDTMHAQTILAIGRDGDLDHGIVEPHHAGDRFSDRRILGKFDDSLMLVGKPHLPFRTQHAPALDTSDPGCLELHAVAGNGCPHRGVHTLHAGVRIGRPADHIEGLRSRVDGADLKPVRIGVRAHLDNVRHREWVETRSLVDDLFDFETDGRQRVDDPFDRGIRLEVLLEPGESELHRARPPARVGTSNGAKP